MDLARLRGVIKNDNSGKPSNSININMPDIGWGAGTEKVIEHKGAADAIKEGEK